MAHVTCCIGNAAIALVAAGDICWLSDNAGSKSHDTMELFQYLNHLSDCSVQCANGTRNPETTVGRIADGLLLLCI